MFGLFSGNIEIVPDKQSYALGEAVNLAFRLKLKGPLKARRLYGRVRAYYRENYQTTTHVVGSKGGHRHHTSTRDVELFAQDFALDGGKEYVDGATYNVSFQIPQNPALLSQPGFLGILGGRQVIWEVIAKLDMEMSFDVGGKIALNVR